MELKNIFHTTTIVDTAQRGKSGHGANIGRRKLDIRKQILDMKLGIIFSLGMWSNAMVILISNISLSLSNLLLPIFASCPDLPQVAVY